MKKTLKEIYNLEYDHSPLPLPQWYNKLIDKTDAELDLLDIHRMIQQDVLKDLAVNKAIEVLNTNPFEGYFYDGQFVELLAEVSAEELNKSSNYYLIKAIVTRLESDYYVYDGFECNDDYRKNFINIINKLKNKIN